MPRAHHQEVPGFSMGALTALGSICLPLVFCFDSGRLLLEDCLGANGGCCEGVQAGAGRFRAE